MKLIGVGLAGALLLIGGCGGGSSRLSEREYVRESSAVCSRANRAIARVEPSTPGRVSAKVVAIHRSSVDSLRDLRPPKSYEHTVKVWIALVDQTLDEIDAMRAAWRAGQDAEASAYAEKAVVLDERSAVLAREHGITPCVVPALT